jgi:lysophospholipase L1-like esterase
MRNTFIPKIVLGVIGLATIALWTFSLLVPSSQSTLPIETLGPSLSTKTPNPKVALWFGDSYVEGAGASKKSKTYSFRVSQHYGLFHKNLSEGASGYLGNSEIAKKTCGEVDCLAMIKVLERQKMLRSDVIFVQAGLNDYALTPENANVVKKFYRKLRATYPSSIVISISQTKPFPEDDLQKKIQYLAKKNVTEIGGYYVDIGEPLVGHPEWLSTDGFHPNDLGYEVLANIVIKKTAPILEALLSSN